MVCPSGATCLDGLCTAEYGDATPFSPCNTDGAQSFGAGILLGELITIPENVTLTSLGVVAVASGGDGILAIYSDVGGVPSALLGQTGSTPINAGNNEILLSSILSVAAGKYWVVGEYDTTVSLCVDASTANLIARTTVASYGTVPVTFGTATTLSSVDINYYVVGVLE
jgi:hypothetical protein